MLCVSPTQNHMQFLQTSGRPDFDTPQHIKERLAHEVRVSLCLLRLIWIIHHYPAPLIVRLITAPSWRIIFEVSCNQYQSSTNSTDPHSFLMVSTWIHPKSTIINPKSIPESISNPSQIPKIQNPSWIHPKFQESIKIHLESIPTASINFPFFAEILHRFYPRPPGGVFRSAPPGSRPLRARGRASGPAQSLGPASWGGAERAWKMEVFENGGTPNHPSRWTIFVYSRVTWGSRNFYPQMSWRVFQKSLGFSENVGCIPWFLLVHHFPPQKK